MIKAIVKLLSWSEPPEATPHKEPRTCPMCKGYLSPRWLTCATCDARRVREAHYVDLWLRAFYSRAKNLPLRGYSNYDHMSEDCARFADATIRAYRAGRAHKAVAKVLADE